MRSAAGGGALQIELIYVRPVILALALALVFVRESSMVSDDTP
jgi:hypothetical protein